MSETGPPQLPGIGFTSLPLSQAVIFLTLLVRLCVLHWNQSANFRKIIHDRWLAIIINLSPWLAVVAALGFTRRWEEVPWAQPLLNIYHSILVPALLTIPFWAPEGLRSGLHIGMDVINHFRRSKEPFPFPNQPNSCSPCEFELRQKIEARFRGVLFDLLSIEGLSDLVVIGHSQGSVIAIEVLRANTWREWRKNVKVKLITMGSPYTHVYQKYFPSDYPELSNCNRDQLEKWVNIYREDDFVGTTIAFPDDWDRQKFYDEPISPGGHDNYWRDPEALAQIAAILKS
jgi:hypothetical protein